MLIENDTARMTQAFWSGAQQRRRAQGRAVVWVVAAIVVAVTALYMALIPWHSLDADHWFVPWLDHIIVHGPAQSLARPMEIDTDGASGFANYNPPYMYALVLGSMLSPILDSLTIIKLVAIGGAVFCALCLYVLIRQFVSPHRAILCAAAFLLLPTVVLNGAAWGQTDTIYAGLLAVVVAAAVANAWGLMLLAFGAAMAFKLPAVFIGPFLLYVVIAYRVAVWKWLLAPLAYGLLMIPAALAGRSISDLAGIYLDQADTYRWLSMNVPNPWLYIQHFHLMPYEQGVLLGLALAATVGLGLASLALRWRLADADLVLLAVASVALMPFLLPKMHDRYFFPADMMTYAFAVIRPGRRSILAAVCVQLGSVGAYSAIIFGFRAGTYLGAVSMSLAVALILFELAAILRNAASSSAAYRA